MKITIEFDDDRISHSRSDIKRDLESLDRRINDERKELYNVWNSNRLSREEYTKLIWRIRCKEEYVAQLIHCIDKTNQHEELVNNLRYALGIEDDYY